jgi:hypothetical protein
MIPPSLPAHSFLVPHSTLSYRFSEHGDRYTSLPPFLVASLPALHNVLGHQQLYVRQRAVQVGRCGHRPFT